MTGMTELFRQPSPRTDRYWHWGPLFLIVGLIFSLSDAWFTGRLVKEDEHMVSGGHQVPFWYCLYLLSVQHFTVCTVIVAFTVKVLLHSKGKYYIPREMSLSHHTVSIWKAQRKSCIEDLNYLGRKENIYEKIWTSKAGSNVLVLLLVTIYCNGISQDLKVWSDTEALFQIS